MRDHPVIAAMERTGYASPYRQPVCPVCGEECSAVYISTEPATMFEPLGCEHCRGYGDSEVCPACGAACDTTYLFPGGVELCGECMIRIDVWEAYDEYI